MITDQLLISILKIIAKALANRLIPKLQELIGNQHTDCIAGRKIFDGVAITQEVIHQNKKINDNGYLMKLNFEKAYNMVDQGYLLEVLKLQGFGKRWILWIAM